MLGLMSIPPNRIAALASVLTALAGTVATLLGAVDTLPKALVMCVFILAVAAVAIVFLLGWQRHEKVAAALEYGPAIVHGHPASTTITLTPPATGPTPAPVSHLDEPGDALPALPHLSTADPADVPADEGDPKSVAA